MKLKKLVSTILILSILFTFLSLNFGFTASAQTEYTEGYYTYTVSKGEATIIRCDTSITGEVVIPDTLNGYPVTSIDSNAFYMCDSFTGIILPEGITNIQDHTFHNRKLLKNVVLPKGLTRIGYAAFCDTSIESIVIPDSVKYIGQFAFFECDNLKKITLPFVGESDSSNQFLIHIFGAPAYNELEQFGENDETGSQEWVTFLPDSLETVIISKKCKKIYENAFYCCSSINNIILHDELKILNSNAFYKTGIYNNSNNWKNKVLYIGNYCIEASKDITGKREILAGTKTIINGAFKNCKNLESITIPKSVTSVGQNAFYGCSKLGDIYYGGNEIDWANITVEKNNSPITKATIHYTYSNTDCKKHTYLSKDSVRCGVCGKERNNDKTEKPNNTTSKNENSSSKNNTTNNKDKVNSSNSSQPQSNAKTENSSINKSPQNINSTAAKGDEENKENESVKNESTTNDNTADITPETAEPDKNTENNGSLLAIVITVLIVLSLGAVVLFVLYKKGIIILNKK